MLQEAQVALNRLADARAIAAVNLESGVDLGHPFGQPQWPVGLIMPQQQVGVFVKNDLEGAGLETGQRQHHQVLVAAAAEERRQVGRLALVERQKRLHGGWIGKGHDDDRRRRHRLRSGQPGVSVAKLLEPHGEPGDLLRGAATKDMEIGSAGFEPVPLRQRIITRLAWGRRRQSQQRGGNPKRVPKHTVQDSKASESACHHGSCDGGEPPQPGRGGFRAGPVLAGGELRRLGQFRAGGVEELHALGDLGHRVIPVVFVFHAERAVEMLALELGHLGFDVPDTGAPGHIVHGPGFSLLLLAYSGRYLRLGLLGNQVLEMEADRPALPASSGIPPGPGPSAASGRCRRKPPSVGCGL